MQTIITFPEVTLSTRDAHKLRGYIGNLFQDRSPLLHNHLEASGKFRYAYPLVQYKVVRGLPMLIGYKEGAKLLMELFLDIKEIQIGEFTIPVPSKNIACEDLKAGYSESLQQYQFQTLWMPLNQKNYKEYRTLDKSAQNEKLQILLRNHILAAFKGLDIWLEAQERIMCMAQVEERKTQFKEQQMMAFRGSFTTNANLPDYIGLGKSVARGFGTIIRK